MLDASRRKLLTMAFAFSGAAVSNSICLDFVNAKVARGYASSPEGWFNKLQMHRSSPDEAAKGILLVGRFRDPMYFLTSAISWHPSGKQTGDPIEVPVGFVTDFASIPRIFWSLLRPDGEYAHAAVIHDYLYWTQSRPRNLADQILKNDMEDLRVKNSVVSEIYTAVRAFGASAWNTNAELKLRGEKRILKTFPTDPSILWDDWKKRSDVFI